MAAASATLRDKVEATRSEEAQRAPLFSGCVENSQQFGAPPAPSAASTTSSHLATHPHARVRGAVVHADALVASFEQELVLRRAVAAELRYGAVDEQRAAPHVMPLYVPVMCVPPLITIPTYM